MQHATFGLLLVGIASAAGACGGGATRTPPPASAPAAALSAGPGSLARFAAEQLVVLPMQALTATDPLGWKTRAGSERELLARVDSLLESELRGRGLIQWTYAPALIRAARRNPTYLVDPTQLRAGGALRAAARQRERTLAEPFASQVRALVGVSGSRYVLVPFELAFVPDSSGNRGAVALALAVADARLSQLLWIGDVRGASATEFSGALLQDVVQRAADLVVIR